MRGKLRDKRATNRRDILKREMLERRRTNKRDNRLPTQLEQFDDDDYKLELDEEQEENTAISKK
jgi:hypothetical protein